MSDLPYLHGYSDEEQKRLLRQAELLAPFIFPRLRLPKKAHLLELACGVGAQTEILLKQFPDLEITAFDLSPDQLKTAEKRLKKFIDAGRLHLLKASAEKLPFADKTFDAAFCTWFLEHLKTPLDVLNELRRVLKPGAKTYFHEVMNACFFIEPYSAETLKYWFEFNDHQWTLGGDPFVGAKLGNLLTDSKFANIRTEVVSHHFDKRHPTERAAFIDEWTALLLSAAPGLIKDNRISPEILEKLKKELNEAKNSENSVFFFAWVRAEAERGK